MPSLTGAEEGELFARLLHAGCRGFACILEKDATTERTRVLWTPACSLPVFERRESRHVWLSVCTFAERSRKAHAALDVPALWADLDPPEGADLETWRPAGLARLREFNPPASLVVDSGRGFHGYWLLAEPVALDRGDRARAVETVEGLNRALAVALDGDDVGDLSRVMRLPGLMNPKPDGGLCRLLRADGRRYALADVIAALRLPPRPAPEAARGRECRPCARVPAFAPAPPAAAVEPARRGRGRPPLVVRAHDLRKLPPWARRLVVGGAFRFAGRYRKLGGVDRSRADLAAAGAMVRAGWTDAMIRAAFERNGWLIGARFRDLLAREGKRRADDYLTRTLARARGVTDRRVSHTGRTPS